MALKARTSVGRGQPPTAAPVPPKPSPGTGQRRPSRDSSGSTAKPALAARPAARTPPRPDSSSGPRAAARAAPAAGPLAPGPGWRRTSSSTYDAAKMVDAGPPVDTAGMVRCPGCERTFAPGPFEKHERICAKVWPLPPVGLMGWQCSLLVQHSCLCQCIRTQPPPAAATSLQPGGCGQVFQSKRKPMDMAAQRAVEDDKGSSFGAPPPLPALRKKGARAGAAGAPPPASPAPAKRAVPKWKAQSGQLRAAMAATRCAKTGDLPFAVPAPPDDVRPTHLLSAASALALQAHHRQPKPMIAGCLCLCQSRSANALTMACTLTWPPCCKHGLPYQDAS